MHVRRSLGRHLAGALTAPVFVLAACGGGDSVADPPVSSPPTSSPTQPPKHESPEAFIRRWAAEDSRMQNTGDTHDFRAMSKSCSGCDSVADRVDSIYEAGGKIRTRGWALVRVYESDRGVTSRTMELIVDSAPTTYSPSRGASPRHLEGGREHFQVRLEATRHSWLVSEFVQIGS